MLSGRRTYDASGAGVGDLAIGLWIAEGARLGGAEIQFVRSGYDQVVEAFGFRTADVPSSDCLPVGGASLAYAEELDTSVHDRLPRTLRWQRTVGWEFTPARPRLANRPEDAVAWANGVIGNRPTLVIAPRAAHTSRSLPIQKWIRIAWALHAEGIHTIAIDRAKDVVEPFPFFAFGYDWHHVLALLSKATVVAGNDSGITHLAATLGVPTVAALGPTDQSIVFGHCLDVVRVVGMPSVSCFGCHFRYDKGYRVACDHGCEALPVTPWQSLEAEIRAALDESWLQH